jgi:LysR family cys regulon transcriptional activator
MTLRQLRCLCEVINARFNLSLAARALHLSQPGVSRYLKMLESELGVPLFVKAKNRFTRLTPAGQAIADVARRTLRELETIPAVARDHREGDAGSLVIATNPGHARYSLPAVMERFIKRHPRVRVRIRQGDSSQVSEWVQGGEAELFISTGPTEPNPELALFPCQAIHPVVLAPARHPLTAKRRVTLHDLCACPIITYDTEFAFHRNIMRTFHAAKLRPDILLSASDAEIMKIYARAGLGIAIVAHSAYNKRLDRGLRAIDVSHLFNSTVLHVGLRRNAYLTRHLTAFLQLFAPHLKIDEVRRAIAD